MAGESKPRIIFPEGFDARWEAELPDKGCLTNVFVEFEGGLRYRLCFYDPVRLRQDLESDVETGCSYFAEPGLVLLPEVNRAAIVEAVDALTHESYFESLMPDFGEFAGGSLPLVVLSGKASTPPRLMSSHRGSSASA